MKDFKKHFLGALVFLGTISFGILGYAALNNLPTVSENDSLTDEKWNEVIQKLNMIGETYAPSGAVMAFYLTSCPTGWKIADGTNGTPNLRGEFIRGLDNGRGIDSGRTLGSYQPATEIPYPYGPNGTQIIDSNYNGDGYINRDSYNFQPTITSWNEPTSWQYTLVRPRNIALLYCVKE